MIPFGRRGRQMLKTWSGAVEAMRVPHLRDSDDVLLADAKRIALPCDRIGSSPLPPASTGFIRQLEGAGTALRQTRSPRQAAGQRRSQVTRALRGEMRRAREIIAVLDAAVAAACLRDRGRSRCGVRRNGSRSGRSGARSARGRHARRVDAAPVRLEA